jgi:hypothetical protein
MRQDMEELKFNEERRRLDFEEVRKENLGLHIKMEDYEFVSDQVENLRKICDKLEEEKKIAVFREEAIRLRLSNFVNKTEERENIKDGLQAILNFNHGVFA